MRGAVLQGEESDGGEGDDRTRTTMAIGDRVTRPDVGRKDGRNESKVAHGDDDPSTMDAGWKWTGERERRRDGGAGYTYTTRHARRPGHGTKSDPSLPPPTARPRPKAPDVVSFRLGCRLGRSTARQSHRPSLALASASVPFHSTPVHPRLQSSFKPATPGHHQLQLRRWEEEERRRAAGLHHEQQVAGLRNRLQPPASSRACAHLPAGAGYYSPASASASGEKPSQPWGACARGGCRRTRRRRRARWRPPTTRAA